MMMKKTLLVVLVCGIFFQFNICCKDNSDTLPPFNFNCRLKFIAKDGQSILNEHNVNKIVVNMMEPDHYVSITTHYLDHYDVVSISLSDVDVSKLRVDKEFTVDYIMDVILPNEISERRSNILKISFKFTPDTVTIKNAYFNDEAANFMASDVVEFEIATMLE